MTARSAFCQTATRLQVLTSMVECTQELAGHTVPQMVLQQDLVLEIAIHDRHPVPWLQQSSCLVLKIAFHRLFS